VKKEVMSQIKETDFVIERAYGSNKWLRDNYHKLFTDKDFLREWKEKYDDNLFKAKLSKHIYGRCIYKQTIKALHNMECYIDLFNDSDVIKAIRKKPVIELMLVNLLNEKNVLIQIQLRGLLIDYIESDKLTMVLMSFKKRLIGKSFEAPWESEDKENTKIKKSAFQIFTNKVKALLR